MIRGTVLILDDEPMVTKTLEGVLGLDEGLSAVTFNDARPALGHLREERVDAIVSDFVMPGMNGLEFLAEAKTIQPEAARILLTGYADKDSAIQSINEIGLYQYIEKPWRNEHLLMVLRNAVERSELLRNLRELDAPQDEIRDKLWKMLI